MNEINVQYYNTSVGELIMGSFHGKLCLLDYKDRIKRTVIDNRILKGLNAVFVEKDDELLQQTRMEVDEYLSGERKTFSIPLLMVGSEFQKKVWNALLEIPYGETKSYLQVSKVMANTKAVRAVANANGANSMSIIIPCHRIIASDGSLGGYAGGIKSKELLLVLENSEFLINGQKKLDL